VQDSMIVRRRDSRAKLTGDVDRLVLGESADAAQQSRQILSIDILHANKGNTVGFSDVENAADVGVGDLASNANFAVKAGERGSVLHQLLRQELQGHVLIELEVLGAIDLTHAAAPDQRNDTIAICEQRTGKNSPALSPNRGRRESARWI